ncbi:hypothetical protein AB0G35_25055 [Streptomyces sp. NPDC021749]
MSTVHSCHSRRTATVNCALSGTASAAVHSQAALPTGSRLADLAADHAAL